MASVASGDFGYRRNGSATAGKSVPAAGDGKTHYAVSEHVKGWHKRIKKSGSLEAAYAAVNKELHSYYKEQGLDLAPSQVTLQ
jgi:hypothetical protein